MISLAELKQSWSQDSEIDINSLADASILTPNLHSKYLNYLVDAKRSLVKLQSDLYKLRAIKERYWRGELSAIELDDLGWQQWQYSKVTRAEMDKQADGDADLIAINEKVEYLKLFIYAAESIISQIKQRDFAIGNSIKMLLFNNGVQV